jgi:predicted transcriptional regulator
MRKAPIRLSDAALNLLTREAILRAESRTIKEIATQIGASQTYVQEQLSQMVKQIRERQKIVPRGTKKTGEA